jgi:tripartite-type tricarboxylate transporter receptor subunit TctC
LPRNTPAPIVQKLHDVSVAALQTPSVQEKLKAIGAVITPAEHRSPEYLRGHVAREVAKWGTAIKAAGAQIE